MNYESNYKPHSNQLKVHTSHAKYKVVVAGRRWGKSALGLNEALVRVLGKKKQICWIILPTYRQAKEIYWIDPDVVRYFRPYVDAGILKKNDTELSLYAAHTDSWLRLKGADNPDSLRGSGLDLIVWDEVADVKQYAFEAINPALADSPHHRVLYIGTPKGYGNFHDLALRGDHKGLFPRGGKDIEPEEGWMSWHFSSYDNTAFPEGSVEREQFVKYLDIERSEKEEQYFAQEYLAEFVQFAGAVYSDFRREEHVIDSFDIPREWKRFRGVDFGSTNPTVCLWVAVDPEDNWYVYDEHYEGGESIDYHCGIINAKTMNQNINGTFGDPSGAQWIREFGHRNVYITPATKDLGTTLHNWVRIGIEKVQAKLKVKQGRFNPKLEKDNQPSLYVFSRCKNTIREFELYRWKTAGINRPDDANLPDIPEKANDHAMDALRYFAVSYQNPISEEPESQWTKDQWRIGK